MSTVLFVFWAIYPGVAIYATNYIMVKFRLHERFNLKSVDVATVLLFIGLHGLSVLEFTKSVVPYFLISVFFLGIGVAIFQGYFYEEIRYVRFFKMFWRLTFLLTILLYVFLIIFSIVTKFI